MAEDYLSVNDDITKLVYDAWQAGAQAAAGAASVPELVVSAADRSGHGTIDRPTEEAWGRITIMHQDAPSSSIGGGPGRTQLIDRLGLAWVECRAPNIDATAYRKAILLGQVVQKSLERKRVGSLWFPRVILREVDEEGSWRRVDVLGDFTWTEAV